MAAIRLKAPAIECEGCAQAINRSLARLSGVSKVDVDVVEKLVRVEYSPEIIQPTAIVERLGQAGFPAVPE